MAEAHLPGSLIEVAETLGLGTALKLMQHYGGQEVNFPLRLKDGHELISLLGEEQANALCHYMSGQQLYVPHGRRSLRRQEVEKLRANGMTRSQIARALGISQRHVRRLANGDPPEQLPLFHEEP